MTPETIDEILGEDTASLLIFINTEVNGEEWVISREDIGHPYDYFKQVTENSNH